MNIQMQVCGLIVLVLLLYFYKRQDTVGLFTEILFKRALYTCIVCLVLDILSVILIMNMEKLPLPLVRLECKMYLVSLVCTGYVALVYACSDAFRLAKANQIVKMMGIAVIAVSFVIFVLPIRIFREGTMVYTYGPSCMATYIGAVVLILVTLFYVTRSKNGMNPRRSRAIRIWMGIWLLSAVIQLFNSELLLVGFASAIGIEILFFELENPEGNIDRKSGLFNAGAFNDFMRYRFNGNETNCIMLISLEDANANDVDEMDDVMLEVAGFIKRISEAKKFKTDEKEYTLVFDNRENLDRAYAMIDARFQKEWLEEKNNMAPIMLSPYYVLVPSGKVAKNVDEMLGILKYFKAHSMDNPESHIVVVDDNNVAKKRAREEMIATLVSAMKEDRVEVFFQPIYSTHEKKFVSAEALVRIRKKDGSVIPPGLFIPIAEETGLIGKLGELVFEQTCKFIKNNKPEQYGLEYIEVNLSVVQCENRSLTKMYIDIMDEYKVDPAFINLEITESASIIMKKTLLENMKVLIDYGVSFSLDDFGNGESNLNYIVDMPVRIVKFDRDMTQAYFENEKAKYVLQAATDMIQGLKLKVVAEGVETADQLKELERLGIDYIQGYYFSKPIEAAQFIEFLKIKNC